MIVVRHQAVRVTQPVELLGHFSKYLEELLLIGVIKRDALIGVAASGNVVHRTWVIRSLVVSLFLLPVKRNGRPHLPLVVAPVSKV